MKKTFTINLGGIVFHIDEDAYELLDNYLNNLRIHFSKEEGAEEIVHDMELRISELFSERLNEAKEVITIRDVEEIIARMGKPEEFSGGAADETEADPEQKDGKSVKRLFRDPDDKVIGGVCSGIAAYLGWDVTLVRLIFLFFGFFVHGTILAYILAWIIIPEANTASEKLSMKGIKANVENIGKTVTEGFEKVNSYVNSDRPRSFFQKLGEGIVTVAGFLIKCILTVLAICATPVLFVLLSVFVVLLLVTTGVIAALPAIFYQGMPHVDWSVASTSPVSTAILSVAGILVIGIPIVGFIHFLMSTFGGWKPMPMVARGFLVGLWLVSLGVGTFFFLNFGFAAF